ncbi:MAG: NAD(+) synthase [Paludibacteraceae bacterium]|nr:NAD(+) synthase [Paludibacteraceae bacterium]
MDYGFVRVAAAVPRLRVGDCKWNAQETIKQIDEAIVQGVQIICFPELGMTGYTCADLFFNHRLQNKAMIALQRVCQHTKGKNIIAIVGAPLMILNQLYNCSFVMIDGDVVGVVPKLNLPNTGEFYEKRWFASGRTDINSVELWSGDVPFGHDLLFLTNNFGFGIEMCEDLWCPLPPSTQLCVQGADLIFNPSASNCITGKHEFRRQMLCQQSARTHCGYIYSSAGIGESTTDLVFSGSTYIAENGEIIAEGERFLPNSSMIVSEIDIERLRSDRERNTNFNLDKKGTYRKIYTGMSIDWVEPIHRTFNPHPFLPSPEESADYCNDVLTIQTVGLARRWEHTHADTLVVGISGGLDSTLALLVATRAADFLNIDHKKVIGVTMPGFGTSGRTYQNALDLMTQLGVEQIEIPIGEATTQHLSAIGHDISIHNSTYENAQARERTQILMDLANEYNGLVVGTGDLSELALGWATYNGDQMSMYGVNAGIPKTLVRYLVNYVASIEKEDISRTLKDIVDTPVSPELLPAENATEENGLQTEIAQKTEDNVGPYELHDFFIYYFLRYGFSREKIAYMANLAFADEYESEEIDKWLETFMKRFFTQQFKRSCMPDGPKVTSVSLSPRGDWRMPSDMNIF